MNNIEIVKGLNQKPESSKRLVSLFEEIQSRELSGTLYVGYPILSTPNGKYPIDAIFVSPNKGVILFYLVEGVHVPDDYKETQDDIYNKLEAKLRNHKELMNGRTLDVSISPITFAPEANNLERNTEPDYIICSKENLISQIKTLNDIDFEKYNEVLSVLQSISTIRKGKKREIKGKNSRGAKLKKIEDSVANLDSQQAKAVIESIRDVQRIRGLAGSGKTIVLALKAAYLHSQHPDWKIAVTFFTRSLKGQFKDLINTFTIGTTGEEPNWDNLKIVHAWGSGSNEEEGIYYNFCIRNEIELLNYSVAKNRFGSSKAFEGACSSALKSALNQKEIPKQYDAILIDEAQDLPIPFLKICFHILGDKKILVYAYDELQCLNSNSLPSPEEIFGQDSNGVPLAKITEKSQDIILKKCYRNSKPILTTAHALGFGIYRDTDSKTKTGLIQMFEDKNLWNDIGYSHEGELLDDKEIILERTAETSPEFLAEHSDNDDLIQFLSFKDKVEQDEWVAEQIEINLGSEELGYDDIIVINPNPLTTKDAIGTIRSKLFEKKIPSHFAGVDTSPDTFFKNKSDSVVFTGIHRAKGNEAGMVYVINSQECYNSSYNLVTIRNQLFTAITRSKAWVRVVGFGDKMNKLKEEFNKIKENQFSVKFTYPNEELRKKLNLVNRDKSILEKKEINKAEDILKKAEVTLTKIYEGKIRIEDIDSEVLSNLKKSLENNE